MKIKQTLQSLERTHFCLSGCFADRRCSVVIFLVTTWPYRLRSYRVFFYALVLTKSWESRWKSHGTPSSPATM